MFSYKNVSSINAKVGVYLRISLEDGDKIESNSIENQRKIIYEYLRNNNFTNIQEFIDDGATGTNFNRKGFKQMIEAIEKGSINMVITKDVSRIGRNYVKTGYYIEDYFLNKSVRYISILDDIDTYADLIGNELLPFRAILNDMYSRDISQKQRSSIIERKKRGKYTACYAPYGYEKDKIIKGKLNIDEVAASVVRRTFNLFLEGFGTSYIAKLYTEEKIPTPAMHLNMNVDKNSLLYTVWKPRTIKCILRNKTYLGYMIQNKQRTISHKNHKSVNVPDEERIIIENHHQPIIDQKDFEEANKILDSKKKGKGKSKTKTILHDLLYCKECQKKLSRKDDKGKIYYFCTTRSVFHLCDNSNYIAYYALEEEILKHIKHFIKEYSNNDLLEQAYIAEYSKNKTRAEEYNACKLRESKELQKINNKLEILYNDKLDNVITDDMYKKHSAKLKEHQKELTKKIYEYENLINEENNKIKLLKEDQKRIVATVQNFCNLENINAEIAMEFIEKIAIDKNKEVHLKLKFPVISAQREMLRLHLLSMLVGVWKILQI